MHLSKSSMVISSLLTRFLFPLEEEGAEEEEEEVVLPKIGYMVWLMNIEGCYDYNS